MRHQIRFSEGAWESLVERLLHRRDVETAAVLIGRPFVTDSGWTVSVEDVVVVPDDGYRVRRADQLEIDPVVLNRIASKARDRGRSIVTVHTHPTAGEPWFSRADDICDARLMPSFAVQVPEVPHGAIVLAGSGIAEGRLFFKDSLTPASICALGKRLVQVSALPDSRSTEWFSRQELALGAAGQQALRRLRVAIVGLGGTGSVTALQLGHLGVAELVLIDDDIVEATNLARIAGATTADVGVTPKVEVARRYIGSTGLQVAVETHPIAVYGEDQLRLLRGCDVIFSCVDRHSPRALLNRLAYDAMVPIIDMGSGFRVGPNGTITSCGGRVVVVGPGRRCLACWGDLDPEALRREALDVDARESEVLAGYISGADVPQPSVIPFNTMLAGAAVIEFLRMVTAFAGIDEAPGRLAFAFATGAVHRNALAPASCRICGGGTRHAGL